MAFDPVIAPGSNQLHASTQVTVVWTNPHRPSDGTFRYIVKGSRIATEMSFPYSS